MDQAVKKRGRGWLDAPGSGTERGASVPKDGKLCTFGAADGCSIACSKDELPKHLTHPCGSVEYF